MRCASLALFTLSSVALTLTAPAARAGDVQPGSANLVGFATVDNSFAISVSTSPTTAGTPWFSGSNWQSTFSGSLLISTPGTYYIQVFAQDLGRPEMFIGRFTLAGLGATFANGTQELLTNTSDWVVSISGFGIDTTAPIFLGDNGAGPWGTVASMGSNADFIWAPQYANGQAFFTASFTVVPTPGAVAMLGLGGLVAARRRRA